MESDNDDNILFGHVITDNDSDNDDDILFGHVRTNDCPGNPTTLDEVIECFFTHM